MLPSHLLSTSAGERIMIAKTHATVLRVTPYRSSSHVVTWLTAGGNRIATIVKGATRARSMFLGQYDLAYTCELLYYIRESQGIHHIRECTPLTPRARLRSDWCAAACASYMCHLVALTTPPGAFVPRLYALLNAALDAVEGDPTHSAVMWFEYRLLDELGLSPKFDVCTGCRAPVDIGAGVLVDPERGGAVCSRCAPSQARPTSGPVRLGAEVTRHLLSCATHRSLSLSPSVPGAGGLVSRFPQNQEFQANRFFVRFLAYHLDLPPECRNVVFRLLQYAGTHDERKNEAM